MTVVTAPSAPAAPVAPVLDELSTLDRFLPVWIGAAMAAGVALGRLVPGLDDTLERVEVDTVSLPIALGLLLMMYPVLAKVRYSKLGEVTRDRRMLVLSLVLNWVVGPALMFGLAWLLLPDLPEYRTGLVIVGLARCIAMVLIWNDLASGNREAATFLVAVNSLFQIVAYSLLGYFYLELLPGWLGFDQQALDVSIWEIARAVLIFLGVPLVAGFLTRLLGERHRGVDWYEQRFLPAIGPLALYGLLFTIVVLFALQGDAITSAPLDVVRIALPLLAYFALMWGSSFAVGLRLGLPYDRNTTVAFTAAGNNFELAIAVAIGTFGVTSGQALAGVVGPLIEVPVLVGLVYVARWARRRFYPPTSEPIACSLGHGDMDERLEEWRQALGHVTRREPIPGGLRLTLGQDAPAADVLRLATAEHECCRFFSFAVTVDGRGTALEVTAPSDAAAMVDTVFGGVSDEFRPPAPSPCP